MSTLKLKSLKQGQTYAFRYPNFEGGTDYRRMLLESVDVIDGRVMITGTDLDHGNEGKWCFDMMQRVEAVAVAVIPRHVYRCRWGGREVSLHVWSCYPNLDGNYRVTGKIKGHFVAMDIVELTEIELVDGRREVCNGGKP